MSINTAPCLTPAFGALLGIIFLFFTSNSTKFQQHLKYLYITNKSHLQVMLTQTHMLISSTAETVEFFFMFMADLDEKAIFLERLFLRQCRVWKEIHNQGTPLDLQLKYWTIFYLFLMSIILIVQTDSAIIIKQQTFEQHFSII